MAISRTPIRVLVAKPGLDGHDRGAKVVAKAFVDAGMEVVYSGLHQRVNQIVSTAIDEDVDVVGLSIMSGAYMGYTRRVMAALREQRADDKLIVVGGVIPAAHVPALKELGVHEVFVPGTRLDDIISYVKEQMELRRETPR